MVLAGRSILLAQEHCIGRLILSGVGQIIDPWVEHGYTRFCVLAVVARNNSEPVMLPVAAIMRSGCEDDRLKQSMQRLGVPESPARRESYNIDSTLRPWRPACDGDAS